MRIVIHDFAGHPGQVQLSRELAHRGHIVEHQFCESVTTGQGATSRRPGDPETFSIKSISLDQDFARYSPGRRILQELTYGYSAIRAILAKTPDVVVLSNVPLIPLTMASIVFTLKKIPYVFWWQDVYSDAIGTVARRRLKYVGGAIAWLAARIERGSAKRASGIVPITDAFVEKLDDWSISRQKVTVIPNWGALDEIEPRNRSNSWAVAHSLDDVKVVMYTGTLGLKHDPSVLAELAENGPDDCRVVVVSQGMGREWLEEHCGGNPKIVLMDYQPYEKLPDMLGSADVLVVILEKDASRYSVPSKVLNYLCAGRPVLAVLPSDNSVAAMVESAEAGIVVSPGDAGSPSQALGKLLSDEELRTRMGTNARRYAERVFELARIGDEFEVAIQNAYMRKKQSLR